MLALIASLVFLASPASSTCSNVTVTGCEALASALPSSVFFPNSDVYEYEAQNYW